MVTHTRIVWPRHLLGLVIRVQLVLVPRASHLDRCRTADLLSSTSGRRILGVGHTRIRQGYHVIPAGTMHEIFQSRTSAPGTGSDRPCSYICPPRLAPTCWPMAHDFLFSLSCCMLGVPKHPIAPCYCHQYHSHCNLTFSCSSPSVRPSV